MLEQERAYYNAHCQEWVEKYPGKTVLVKGDSLVGTYDSPDNAVSEGIRLFGKEPFLVRPIGFRDEDIKVPALTLGLLNAPH
ncbi:MAG TPA: hypothetical protein VFJ58_07105 [Armatimonadota bacterium]|nr:hypothetical protein [Armatimonadota bacterium]